MVFFVISILLTVIILFIYLKFFGKKEGNIEEESDYKDVGGIVKEENKETDGKNTDEGKKINEEEE